MSLNLLEMQETRVITGEIKIETAEFNSKQNKQERRNEIRVNKKNKCTKLINQRSLLAWSLVEYKGETLKSNR